MSRKAALALAAVLPLGGCLTLSDGTSQAVAVTSTPPGAECQVASGGVAYGAVTTPGTVRLARTSHNVEIACARAGYLAAAI